MEYNAKWYNPLKTDHIETKKYLEFVYGFEAVPEPGAPGFFRLKKYQVSSLDPGPLDNPGPIFREEG